MPDGFMISTANAAVQLGVSPRRVRTLLEQGRIEGAVKVGGTWMVPSPVRVTPRAEKAAAK